MAVTTSFELHVRRGRGWIIDQLFEDKETAVREARALYEDRRLPAVRVVEERYDSETGEVAASVVLRIIRDAPKKDAPTFRRPPRPAGPAVAVATRQRHVVREISLMLFGVCVLGVTALVGLAWLADYLR